MKLQVIPANQQQRKVFDINKRCAPKVKKQYMYTIKLRNCFSALENDNVDDQDTVETTTTNNPGVAS